MAMIFYFQNLEVYQLGKELVIDNYQITNTFPHDEKFCLINQMNRAAISVPSNIAEGTARNTKKDKVHFINMAYGSLMELICQMEIALDLGYIEKETQDNFISKAKNLSIKLSNFKSVIEKSDK
ncbi:MAG: four helix bundle protein [Synergistaceae bacterium]